MYNQLDMFHNDPFRIQEFSIIELQIVFPIFLLYIKVKSEDNLMVVAILFFIHHLLTYVSLYYVMLDYNSVKTST